jgi:hypothetical protein
VIAVKSVVALRQEGCKARGPVPMHRTRLENVKHQLWHTEEAIEHLNNLILVLSLIERIRPQRRKPLAVWLSSTLTSGITARSYRNSERWQCKRSERRWSNRRSIKR